MALLGLLFLLSWFAATVSGAAGFGGALLLLPLLTYTLGVKTAVPVLTLMQLLGNLSRVWFGHQHIHWKPIIFFLAGALPFAITGSVLFTGLSSTLITRGIGVLLILIVVLRRSPYVKHITSNYAIVFGGMLTGFVSGIAGSAGPLGAAFFFALELPAVAYVASEAVTAVSMHIAKIIIYQRYALLGVRELQYGLALGIAMILGSWTGKRIIERLSRERFRMLVELLLFISAVQLIVFT